MAPELELNLPKPAWQRSTQPSTPSEWFAEKFPDATSKYGCPFLEFRQTNCDGFSKIVPISINTDFFAGLLRGDSRLGHSVIYYEPELQFYYLEPLKQIYKPTSAEKLQNYYRAILIKCAQELNGTDKLNLFFEFRSDKNARAVTNRAKSILACSPEFFSVTSPHQRQQGPELHERVARVFAEQVLERQAGEVLTLTNAYLVFTKFLKQKSMGTVKRSVFKGMFAPIIRDVFNLGLRNDVIDQTSNKQTAGWKGLRAANPQEKMVAA